MMTIPKTLWLTPLGDNSVENWGSIPAAGIMQITSPRHNESISKKNNIRWHGAQGSVNKNTKTPQGTGSTRRTGINVFANDAGSCHLKWHTTSVASPASSHVRFFFFSVGIDCLIRYCGSGDQPRSRKPQPRLCGLPVAAYTNVDCK